MEKANKYFDLAVQNDSVTVAKKAREMFKCVTTSVEVKSDSSEYKKYKKEIDDIKLFYEDLLSSIEPEKIIDTVVKVDSAKCNEIKGAYKRNEERYTLKIKLLNAKISELSEKIDSMPPVKVETTKSQRDDADVFVIKKEREKVEADLAKEKQISAGRLTKIRWLLLLCVVLAVISYILFRKK